MKNDTNEDERSEVIPDVISQSADNLEMKVIDETQTRNRNEIHVRKEGFIDDQTQENEELKMNLYENEGQELEPDSPISNKSVLTTVNQSIDGNFFASVHYCKGINIWPFW